MRPAASSPPHVWSIAHRGASADRPENTLAAFDEALRQRCDAIELDLQLSRDGIPVVYHDRTLRKIGGGWRSVAQATLEELRRLDAGRWLGGGFRGQRIPTLEEVVDRYAARTQLLLEIKLRGNRDGLLRLVHGVVGLLRRRRLFTRVLLLCFDLDVLVEARRLAPAIRCVLNVRARHAVREWRPRGANELHALCADVRGLTPRFASSVHAAGLGLLTFTCNTRREVDRSLEAGAIGVISDRPGWLRSYLRARGRGG